MKQFLIGIDQLINTIFGGWADETLSARVYRIQDNSWWWKSWLVIINHIFFWQNNHCRIAYMSELERSQLPPKYREVTNNGT